MKILEEIQLVFQFDLICENDYLRSLLQMMFSIGRKIIKQVSYFFSIDIYQINWEKIDEQASGNGIRAFLDERVLEIAYHRHGVQKFDLKKSDDNGKTIPDSPFREHTSPVLL